MLTQINSATLFGIDALPITVEVDAAPGLLKEIYSGLPDAIIKESKNRIRSAIKNNGFRYPTKVYTINLAPAEHPKEGTFFDLPIALGMLNSTKQLTLPDPEALYIGELALNGDLRPIRGCINICAMAKEKGIKRLFLPKDNFKEAILINGLSIIPLGNFSELKTPDKIVIPSHSPKTHTTRNTSLDLAEVNGQFRAKRSLEIAASGHHSILLIGSPGSGKSMLIKRLPSLLPILNQDQAIDVYKVHSSCKQIGKSSGYSQRLPFRAPHHSISHIGLIGGGTHPQPGEISLAHNGILFLDELPEFQRQSLETLRQPLEDKRVTISRSKYALTFPANVLLAAAMNPCPCGYYKDEKKECQCRPSEIQRYWKKISGPLLDRIDLVISIPRLKGEDFNAAQNEASNNVLTRVLETHQVQFHRYKKESKKNHHISQKELKHYCQLDKKSNDLLSTAIDTGIITGRSREKIIKVARTIADMDKKTTIECGHIAEAMQYRQADKYLNLHSNTP